jgi:hypothetical protein
MFVFQLVRVRCMGDESIILFVAMPGVGAVVHL